MRDNSYIFRAINQIYKGRVRSDNFVYSVSKAQKNAHTLSSHSQYCEQPRYNWTSYTPISKYRRGNKPSPINLFTQKHYPQVSACCRKRFPGYLSLRAQNRLSGPSLKTDIAVTGTIQKRTELALCGCSSLFSALSGISFRIFGETLTGSRNMFEYITDISPCCERIKQSFSIQQSNIQKHNCVYPA